MSMSRAPVNELVRACAQSPDAGEWAEFLGQCAPVAALVAIRVARMWQGGSLVPSTIDDIVQEVFVKLCEHERRILQEFGPRGDDSFLALLRVITASVANDYFRRHFSEKRGGKTVTTAFDEPLIGIQAAPGKGSDVQRVVLFAEIDSKLSRAPGATAARDRILFWLYYLQGLTAEEIAALPGWDLSAKGVESALRRITGWLRNELQPRKTDSSIEPAGEPG
jgi:RNA polymerase sigma-70 factor (ECF subfamily)